VTVAYLERAGRSQRAIRERPYHQWTFADGNPWTLFFRQSNGYLLRFPRLADFEVTRDGSQVQSWAAPEAAASTVRHLYLNQVLPLALSRQGKLVLHASAVDIGGRAVAFVGESGRGKSTLAASFATSGAGLLTDDGLLLEWAAGELNVVPSHPSIRLWQDSQEALLSGEAAMAPALTYTTKARFLAGADFSYCEQPRPLSRIYFLGSGEASSPAIQRAKSATTLIELVRNSFLLDIGEQEMLGQYFGEITTIANMPIHYDLDYPRRFADLPLLREMIIQHANSPTP
jgi:hypothetical protein